MEKDYSFATEYAKSSRASCKSCKDSIPKDSLRMAVMVQSHHFDGKIPNWFHYNCFFKKAKVRNVEEIKNIDTLRWEDQVKIKSQISNTETSETSNEFCIEYSKGNRGKCVKCELKIDQGTIKFSVKENKGGDSKKSRPTKVWYHIPCLAQMKQEITKSCQNFDIEKVNGFLNLNEDDRSEMLDKFKSWKSRKRSKPNDENNQSSKKAKTEDKKLDDKLQKQSQLLWNVRDKLNNEVVKNALVQLLEYNKQFVPKGEAELLNSVADCMVFGSLNSCPECGGFLRYSSNHYKCRTMINEWTKCLYETREVTRHPFTIPKELLDADVLKNYLYKARVRILPMEVSEPVNSELLKGFSFVVDKMVPDYEYSSDKVIETIKALGGVVTKGIGKTTAALISSKSAVNKNRTSSVDNAKSGNVDVVSADFIDNLKSVSLIEAIKKNSIVDWGRSNEELENLRKKNKTSGQTSVLPVESSIKVFTVKGGAAVDPDSDLEKKAHLYQDPNTKDPLNAILGMTDLVRGSNSFYKLQLLEADKSKKWWVFRAWGRIGTTIGGNKIEKFHDFSDALRNFHDIYYDKTGNLWENRTHFQKHSHKFVPIDVDYGEDVSNIPLVSEDSELPVSVQDLIRFIFDMESLKKTMLEFELDLNKMPLGKLSKKQIDLSYGVLKELQEVLMQSEISKTNLQGLSNKFYTMMPHNFGLRAPPLIDSLIMVKEKCEMIDSLMEIEVAYKLMTVQSGLNTVDNQYEKLHNRIEPLDKNADEYQLLETYLQNTHASTHNQYKINIKEIYNVTREGESDRFNSFKKLSNRMMLWHGSRRSNWAGILSQGLRIAPPEAPVQGYMFGKGIYFADMVSKSANYCYTTSDSPEGLLLLCEVALGNISERYSADSTIVLKNGEHSCKGIGATMPDPNKNFVDKDGIIYPIGKPVKKKVKSDLLYNEYIVYDIGQVRQRYLFHVQFKF